MSAFYQLGKDYSAVPLRCAGCDLQEWRPLGGPRRGRFLLLGDPIRLSLQRSRVTQQRKSEEGSAFQAPWPAASVLPLLIAWKAGVSLSEGSGQQKTWVPDKQHTFLLSADLIP